MNRPSDISLDGPWRFRPDPDGLAEAFVEELHYTHAPDARWMRPELDDSSWDEVEVPSCWQDYGHSRLSAGVYRRTFELPASPGRVFLRFGGAADEADVWVNGRCLGSHEGYFAPFELDITDRARAGANLVAVRVTTPLDAPGWCHELGQLKTSFLGALQRWDMIDPEVVPGGLWGEVTISRYGQVRIDDLRVRAFPSLSAPGDADVATCSIGYTVSSRAAQALPARVSIGVQDAAGRTVAEAERSVSVAPGAWTLTETVELAAPELWWTWDLGEQPLYTCTISLEVGDSPSDTRYATFGIRSFDRRDGTSLYLNGVRFFQRGANYLAEQIPSRVTPERYERDVDLMLGANLNTAHVFCHVEQEAFYSACDRAGQMVYQDFPVWLMWSTDSRVVRRAHDVAAKMLDVVGAHPCVGVWNFGSQPSRANYEKACVALADFAAVREPGTVAQAANAALQRGSAHPVDSFWWSYDDADRYADADGWRYDTHDYSGWYTGVAAEAADVPERQLELVTEFGAQALPRRELLERIVPTDALRPPRFDRWAKLGLQVENLTRRVLPSDDLDEFVAASQRYQAEVVRTHVAAYRRRKFRPCNGAHVFAFVDCWPSISWAVVDYDRVPKAAYHALADAMSPRQVFVDVVREEEEEVSLAACVVNDLRAPSAAEIEARLTGGSGEKIWTASATVPANGIVDLEPWLWKPAGPGTYRLDLVYSEDGVVVARNGYAVVI